MSTNRIFIWCCVCKQQHGADLQYLYHPKIFLNKAELTVKKKCFASIKQSYKILGEIKFIGGKTVKLKTQRNATNCRCILKLLFLYDLLLVKIKSSISSGFGARAMWTVCTPVTENPSLYTPKKDVYNKKWVTN